MPNTDADAPSRGQTSEKQVKNFGSWMECISQDVRPGDDVHEYTKNSYGFVLDQANLEIISSFIEAASDAELQNLGGLLRVGTVLRTTQVTSTQWGKNFLRKPEQLATQIFCCAFTVSYDTQVDQEDVENVWAPSASTVLDATYEARFLAALLNAAEHKGQYGSTRLFLPCVAN
jgi:hypothetical protein